MRCKSSTLPEAVKSVLILDTTLPLLKNGKANLNGLSQKTRYKNLIESFLGENGWYYEIFIHKYINYVFVCKLFTC